MKLSCKHIVAGLSFMAVLFSCERKEIVPQPQKKELTAIAVQPANISLQEGESSQLKAVLTPADAEDVTLEWSSAHSLTATVSDNGLVTAQKAGQTRIYLNANGLSAYCIVTVTAKGEEPGPEPEPEPEPEPGEYRTWEDTGADLPDYPTYNQVSSSADFPRVDITWEKPTERISEGEYTWVDGTVRFRDPKEMYSEDTDSQALQMRLRGRGNSSWGAEGGIKHSYKIKLAEHRKVFGMKGDKDWLLLADVQDPTLLRNATALRISRMVSMPWTPKFRAVEVYFNGQYGGCYLLVEAKETDPENKVPVTVSESGEVDSGYYLEIDNKWDNDEYFYTETFLKKIKYKDPENPTTEQRKFIEGYINEVEKLLQNKQFDKETGYWSMMEVDTFINQYIVQELTMNVDGNMRLSTYFAKDNDTRLFMPMVWDFDLALGNCTYLGNDFDLPYVDGSRDGPKGWFVKIRGGYPDDSEYYYGKRKTYYQYMFEDPQFVQALKDRWNVVKPRLDKIPAFIDKMAEYNKPAYDHNAQKGFNPRGTRWYEYPPDSFESWSDAVEWLKDWYSTRLEWLDENINAL